MKFNLNEHDFGRMILSRKEGDLTYEYQGVKRLVPAGRQGFQEFLSK